MLYTAFILGLLGSFHCIGMCGPIAFMLPLDRKSHTKRMFQIITYHSGRLFTYAFLGLLLGLLGKQLELFGLQQQISIAIGVIMIFLVILPASWLQKIRLTQPLYRLVSKMKSNMGQQLKRKDPGTFFTLGFLNGLLPCGLVYMAIFASIAVGNTWEASLYMLFFGIGTIPLMTTAIYLGNTITKTVKQRIVKWIPVFVFVIGILFIVRGLGLGIPYVSPSKMVAHEKVSTQHQCH